MMMMWGVLVFAGYLVTWLVPHYAVVGWIAVYVIGIGGWGAFSAYNWPKSGVRTFDRKFLYAFAMIVVFGVFCCIARPFRPAAAQRVLADLFHDVLQHRRALVRLCLHRDRRLPSRR